MQSVTIWAETDASDDFDAAYETIEFMYSYFSNENIDGQTCTFNDTDYPEYEYTCDTGNYFDNEAIQEICDDQGGNKITFELLIKHDNGTTGIIPDVPMCIANSCDPWDIILIINSALCQSLMVMVSLLKLGHPAMRALLEVKISERH